MANEKTANSAKITFSDLFIRLEQAQLTRNHYKLITAAVLGDMLEFFDYYIIGFCFVLYRRPLEIEFCRHCDRAVERGRGKLIGSFFFGYLADRIGRMPVLFLGDARPSQFQAASCSSPRGKLDIPLGISFPGGIWGWRPVFR